MTENALIQVTQSPIIEERLRTAKEGVDKKVAEALSLVCTEESIRTVKAYRADLKKQFDALEEQRKAVKAAVFEPYNRFEEVYKECVSEPFKRADADLKRKIDDVEAEIKRRCEEGLREYFSELCAANHVEWLEFEQTGVKVDLTSAKAKTPKKLREQLASFVANTVQDIDAIADMENADEVLAEYKQCLNFAEAVYTVQERHKRIEAEREAKAEYEAAKARDAEAVKKVEALAPPVAVKPEKNPNDIIPQCTFTVYDVPRWVLQQIKEIFERNGLRYE